MDPHNIWTSDYPSTLGGLSLGVIEVGQAGTVTTVSMNRMCGDEISCGTVTNSKQTCKATLFSQQRKGEVQQGRKKAEQILIDDHEIRQLILTRRRSRNTIPWL